MLGERESAEGTGAVLPASACMPRKEEEDAWD